VTAPSTPCPICHTGRVTGIQLFPLNFSDLEKAVKLRKQHCAQAAAAQQQPICIKRDRDEMEENTNADNATLFLMDQNQQHSRTGRWSQEEVLFVDQLVAGFDSGKLPLPHGIKLNEYLGDILMCKSSRLTKKMKNAKLSSRSFTIQSSNSLTKDECVTLSVLQMHFLNSLPSESMKLELKFIMTKLWRTNLSNLCIQIGYPHLNATEWVASLEEMERRAADSQELVRKARRRRMGIALKQDVGSNANSGVFISGVPANGATVTNPPIVRSTPAPAPAAPQQVTSAPADSGQQQPLSQPSSTIPLYDMEMLRECFPDQPTDYSNRHGGRMRTLSGDFSIGIDDLVDPLVTTPVLGPTQHHPHSFTESNYLGDCGPFLEQVVHYIEQNSTHFEHMDVWVPSYQESSLRLFHAGHATRSNIDASVAFQLHEFGIYSTNFSFEPAHGLPGRVFSTGCPSWECHVDSADSSEFERAGGAKVYGVKTAVGIPLSSSGVGRIILILYSSKHIDRNDGMLKKLVEDLSRWIPEPRWKLVIDFGTSFSVDNESTTKGKAVSMQSISKALPDVEKRHSSALSKPSPEIVSPSTEGRPSTPENIEQKLASLLGDHMPATGDSHCMSLRLLLLRSRRSQEEEEWIDIIKKSYEMYSKENKRQPSELVSLIAKEWTFLQNSSSSLPHQCHIMQQTLSGASMRRGVPTTMPGTLAPPKTGVVSYPNSASSLNNNPMIHNRHGEARSEAPTNIVPDN